MTLRSPPQRPRNQSPASAVLRAIRRFRADRDAGSGLQRRITQSQFEKSLPLIDGAGRALLLEASYNSSYIEAIVDDLRRA